MKDVKIRKISHKESGENPITDGLLLYFSTLFFQLFIIFYYFLINSSRQLEINLLNYQLKKHHLYITTIELLRERAFWCCTQLEGKKIKI